MSKVSFGCTALAGTNKVGKLTADASGYYDMVLGAFDFHNSVGSYYDLESARKIIEGSSALTRRIANGSLYAECGHPKPTPGMTKSEYIARLSIIEETRQCAHIKEVYFGDSVVDERYGGTGILVMGRIKPSGPMGDDLAAKLENPDENVCFSIRSLTLDSYQNGKLKKSVQHIENWDYVTEAGIYVADKWHNPGLEDLYKTIISTEDLDSTIENMLELTGGMESSTINKLKEIRSSMSHVGNNTIPRSKLFKW